MSKRVIAFTVPQTENEVFRVQRDDVPYFYDQLHQHPEIQIMLIESGEGTLIAGDYVGRFGPGEVYVIGSRQPHVFRCDQLYYQSSGIRASSISLYFSETYFGKELWGSNELSAVREFADASGQNFQLRAPDALESTVRIRNILHDTGLPRLIEFFSLLRLLIESQSKKMLSIQRGHLQKSEEGRMNSILEFTFRESHRKIYLNEAAQVANLSVEAFCRYFKIHTRKTYINFLNEVRISLACQLLIHRDSSIEQVCYKAGFANVSNFNRIFKRITNKTPLSFRHQLPFGK